MSDSGKIVYVTRDIERALGISPSEEYRIVTNRTPYAESIQKKYPQWVTLIDEGKTLDTAELMEHEVMLETLSHLKADILVFKNNSQIEEIAKKHNWKILNPSAALAEKIENKISQVEWLGPLASEWLPPHSIQPAKEIKWNKEPLIVQWAHGHTGDSTILVNSAKELKELQSKFPERIARVSTYINGPSFTVNVVVSPSNILVGNVSYQITGMAPFTEKRFTTIGNDWSAAATLLSESELEEINKLARTIGEKMSSDGWSGLFGIDFIKDEERNRLFLLEINARQPASATFESQLQEKNRARGLTGTTLFESHLKALRNKGSDTHVQINDGAQIVQRVTSRQKASAQDQIQSLANLGHTVIEYPNTEDNTDLIRIQSEQGIMESHGKFNTRGKHISELLGK